MCKDKRQVCKGQVSLGMTGGSKENKSTLKHIELRGGKEEIICSQNAVVLKIMQVLPNLNKCCAAVFELKVWEKVEWIAGIEMQVSKAINKIVSLKHSVCWGWLTYSQDSEKAKMVTSKYF